MDYKCFNFPNLGYIECEFQKNDLEVIINEIDDIVKNNFCAISANKSLAGNLEKEFELSEKSKNHLSNLIMPLCIEYDKQFNYFDRINILNKSLPLYLETPWVNFQKKNEFNPAHVHDGIFSFALWIDIPYLIDDEKQNVSSKYSNSNVPGHFIFYYTNSLGKICPYVIPADKNWNNKMILFPAPMTHEVMPFYTSENYRISVSGNFKLKA